MATSQPSLIPARLLDGYRNVAGQMSLTTVSLALFVIVALRSLSKFRNGMKVKFIIENYYYYLTRHTMSYNQGHCWASRFSNPFLPHWLPWSLDSDNLVESRLLLYLEVEKYQLVS